MIFEIKKLCGTRHSLVFWKRSLIFFLGLLFHIGQPASPALAVEKSAEVNSEVQPGRWSAIRLSNVNQGATLKVKLTLDGQATIVLVNEPQLKNYPEVARPLFRTEARGRAQFSYVAPTSGNYYLIVDNRKSALARKYSLSIKASLDIPPKSEQSGEGATGNDPLELLNRVIQTAFAVDPLTFKLISCQAGADTFIRSETVHLCQEFLTRLKNRFQDPREINEIVLFALMRDSGGILLNRWRHPEADNANIRDEFATALLLMFGRREAVKVQAEYSIWLEPDKRERPQSLKEWLDDPFFVKKWQPFLVPKMQTRYLQLLKKQRPAWASRKLVDRELMRRE